MLISQNNNQAHHKISEVTSENLFESSLDEKFPWFSQRTMKLPYQVGQLGSYNEWYVQDHENFRMFTQEETSSE